MVGTARHRAAPRPEASPASRNWATASSAPCRFSRSLNRKSRRLRRIPGRRPQDVGAGGEGVGREARLGPERRSRTICDLWQMPLSDAAMPPRLGTARAVQPLGRARVTPLSWEGVGVAALAHLGARWKPADVLKIILRMTGHRRVRRNGWRDPAGGPPRANTFSTPCFSSLPSLRCRSRARSSF